MLCVGGVHELKLTFFMLKLCTYGVVAEVPVDTLSPVTCFTCITPLDKSTAVAP